MIPPRWQPLARFVERWYAEPLGPGGPTDAEISRADLKVGRRFPPALREWFALVGHRLIPIQDRPLRLDALEPDGDRLPLWWENQGLWSWDLELDGADEPMIGVESDQADWRRREPLVRGLLGLVASDTLVGAEFGFGKGPLGTLRPEVVGGMRDEATPAIDARVAALPALDVGTNPRFAAPPRGHDTLVIRGEPGWWEWMAATDAAFDEARALLELDAECQRRLRVEVPATDDRVGAVLQALRDRAVRIPDLDFRSMAWGGVGTTAILEYETEDPEATLDAVRALLPSHARPSGSHRSRYVARWVPCR